MDEDDGITMNPTIIALTALATLMMITASYHPVMAQDQYPNGKVIPHLIVCPTDSSYIHSRQMCYNFGHDAESWPGNVGTACDTSIHDSDYCEGWTDAQQGR